MKPDKPPRGKLAVLSVVTVIAGAIAITTLAAPPPRPRPVRPKPAPRPARLRPIAKPPRPVVPMRLPPIKPIVVAARGETVVVVDKTAEPAAPPHVPSATEAEPPVDADKTLAGSTAYKIVRLEDGGLTVVLNVDGQDTKVRMVGVAPLEIEQDRPGADRGPAGRPSRGRPQMAELFLNNMLSGESAYVVYDSMVQEEDEDGNCAAYLYRAPDGLMVNMEVVRQGFAAVDSRYDFEEKDSFLHYQAKARELKKGLWRPRGPGPGPGGPPRPPLPGR